MEIITTHQQKLSKDIPTRLEVLTEINNRHGLAGNKELKEERIRLERGFEGEMILLDYLTKHGEKHWRIIKNVWLNYYGAFECDLLLLTNAGIYLFEVKNYSGLLEYKNNRPFINGKQVGHHAINQAQKATVNLNAIFQYTPHANIIKGSIVFIGVDNKVMLDEPVVDINIIRRNELRHFIWEGAETERKYKGYPIDHPSILKTIEQNETDNRFTADNIPDEIIANVQKGMKCANCGSFEIDTKKFYIICSCGLFESREEAIVRTICEYGVMNYKQDFTTTKLTDFFNGDASRDIIFRLLNKHFDKIGSFKGRKYRNKPRPFYIIYDEFQFTVPKYIEMKEAIIQKTPIPSFTNRCLFILLLFSHCEFFF